MKFRSHTPSGFAPAEEQPATDHDSAQDAQSDAQDEQNGHEPGRDHAALAGTYNGTTASRRFEGHPSWFPPTVAAGTLETFPDDAHLARYDPDTLAAWGKMVANADGDVNVGIVPMKVTEPPNAGGSTLMLVAKVPDGDEIIGAAPITADDGTDLLAPGEEVDGDGSPACATAMLPGYHDPDPAIVRVEPSDEQADETEVGR